MIPTLRPYQTDANNRVAASCRQGARVVILQAPTGAGKTNCACDLMGRASAKGSESLFIVHRRRLVDQCSERLREFEIDHGVMMRGHRLERSALVQVASRDTLLSRCVQREFMSLPPAKLVIVDEGRHAASPEMRGLLRHYEDRGAYVILLDATPVMPDGSGLGPWAQALVVAAKVTDLVKGGYLVPVKCFAPDRTLRRGKAKRGIAGSLVASWQEYSGDMPTVLFTSRVQHSRDAVAAFTEAGIPAVHVDADTPDDDRDAAFDGLMDGSVKLVSNVGIIKEGVDVPCLGCCQFYMDVNSRVGFLQGAGRIMRPFPGKTEGRLIDHSGAVFRCGFPDEDTPWSLTGNVDADFNSQKKDDPAEQVRYCKHCELLYRDELACPLCGRMPAKPPRSIFAPPPAGKTSELLVEADRTEGKEVWEREAKVKHWLRCLAVAANKDGTFGMAAAVYQKKYNEFPAADFPCMPEQRGWKRAVLSVYPNFGRKRQKQ